MPQEYKDKDRNLLKPGSFYINNYSSDPVLKLFIIGLDGIPRNMNGGVCDPEDYDLEPLVDPKAYFEKIHSEIKGPEKIKQFIDQGLEKLTRSQDSKKEHVFGEWGKAPLHFP